jgi:hypothetical protein
MVSDIEGEESDGRQVPRGDLAATLLPHRVLDGTRELRDLEPLTFA